jgi:hypothetical protein
MLFYIKNQPRQNEIQLAPTLHHQAEAMMNLLAHYEWFKFSIIVTDFSGSSEFIRAVESFQNGKIKNKK